MKCHLEKVPDLFHYGERLHHYLFFASFGSFDLWVSLVPSESSLIHIALHMLFAHLMENADLGSLQDGIIRLGSIVVDLSPGVLAVTVVHERVTCKLFGDSDIRWVVIAHKVRGRINGRRYKRAERTVSGMGYKGSLNRALAFDSDSDALLGSACTALMFDAFLEPRTAAKIFLVKLDDSHQERQFGRN